MQSRFFNREIIYVIRNRIYVSDLISSKIRIRYLPKSNHRTAFCLQSMRQTQPQNFNPLENSKKCPNSRNAIPIKVNIGRVTISGKAKIGTMDGHF